MYILRGFNLTLEFCFRPRKKRKGVFVYASDDVSKSGPS